MWNLGNIHHILSRVPFKFWPLQSKHLPKTAPQWSLDSLWNLFLSLLEKWMWMTALPWFQLASRYEKKLCLMWNVMRFFRSSLCWPTSRQPPTRPRSPLPFRECSSWSSTKSWLQSTPSLPLTRRRLCWRSLNAFLMICFSRQKLTGSFGWVQLHWGRLALALSNFFCSFFKITFSSGDLLLVFEPTHSFCAGQRRAVRSELQPHSTLWRSGWNDCHCCNHFKSSTSSSSFKWSCCCWWPSSKLLLFLLLGVTRLECMLPMVIVVIISKSSPCLPPPNNPAGGGAHHYDVSPCCSMEVGTRGWRSGSRLWTVESFGGWRSGRAYSWVFGRWANYIGRCKNYFGRWGN